MKHTIMVKLEIEAARWEDACDAVERVLDDGTFQDEINDRLTEDDEDADPPVTSATCDTESGFRAAVLDEVLAIVSAPIEIYELPFGAADFGGEQVAIEDRIRALKDKP